MRLDLLDVDVTAFRKQVDAAELRTKTKNLKCGASFNTSVSQNT